MLNKNNLRKGFYIFRILFLFFITITSTFAFESTNVQILYSNNFKGDAFIYDTKDGEKQL